MKKFLFALMAMAGLVASAQCPAPYQQIGYNVHYHWGPVNVAIAHGTVTTQNQGDTFTATLNGNSIPWDGRVFCISDTLVAQMTPQPGALSSENVRYQTGWYLKPRVREFRSGTFNPSDPANYRNIAGEGTLDASNSTMEAVTVTSDMLGMFYYFGQLDFGSMTPGQQTVINIEGGYSRQVTVTYKGQSTTEASGITYPTYKVEFEYYYQGSASGYPIHAEVAHESRIPVKISASLPAGHVEMVYDGQ